MNLIALLAINYSIRLLIIISLLNLITRLGSSPSLKRWKLAMHVSGEKRRKNMREK